MQAPCYMPSPGPVISTLPQESDNKRSIECDCKSTIEQNMYCMILISHMNLTGRFQWQILNYVINVDKKSIIFTVGPTQYSIQNSAWRATSRSCTWCASAANWNVCLRMNWCFTSKSSTANHAFVQHAIRCWQLSSVSKVTGRPIWLAQSVRKNLKESWIW